VATSAEESNPEFITRFEELGEKKIIHPNIVRTLTGEMGLEKMTEVQSMTINQAIQGNDMYVDDSWTLHIY
jgi:ATP-dependent RNA helicase MSS116, mitochondrial